MWDHTRAWARYEASERRKHVVHAQIRALAKSLACEERGHGDALPTIAHTMEAQSMMRDAYAAAAKF
jgi:hypothetical protein